MDDLYIWDPGKAASNARKHSVTFDEGMSAFRDTSSITISDPDHSFGEERFLLVGYSDRSRLLVVSHVEDGRYVRIISARVATSAERKLYEERR